MLQASLTFVATIQELIWDFGHKTFLIQSIQDLAGLFLPLTILKRKPRPLELCYQHRRHIHGIPVTITTWVTCVTSYVIRATHRLYFLSYLLSFWLIRDYDPWSEVNSPLRVVQVLPPKGKRCACFSSITSWTRFGWLMLKTGIAYFVQYMNASDQFRL
jgi:hypothetical protein